MEIDLAQLDSSATGSDLLRAPICIIGGGIAGLTLAHKLVALGHEILLLEAGGHASDAFGPVQQAGHPHPGTSEPRPRALGGTSLTWGGQLLPFPDDSDWPISSADLAPFTAEAEQLLGVDSLSYAADEFFTQLHQSRTSTAESAPTTRRLALEVHTLLASQPGAHARREDSARTSKARIILHAQVTELLLAPNRDRIEAVLVRTPSGQTTASKPTRLSSPPARSKPSTSARLAIVAEGIGNQHDQVGRNFHDHLTITAATLREPARTQLLSALRPWIHRGTLHSLKLAASSELCSNFNLTPILAHLTIDEPDTSGIGALRTLLRARQQNNLASTLRETLPQLPHALADAARLTLSARTQRRRYVSPQATVQLRFNAAQRTPFSLSHHALAPDLQPILDWRIDPAELATLRFFAQHLRTHLNLDGLDWNPSLFTPDSSAPIPDLDDARHAMGGATMGIDPRSSVVDPDLRVHGLRNLFIASAAVFPDGSPQLPTLPLMALTLRLAQQLQQLTR